MRLALLVLFLLLPLSSALASDVAKAPTPGHRRAIEACGVCGAKNPANEWEGWRFYIGPDFRDSEGGCRRFMGIICSEACYSRLFEV